MPKKIELPAYEGMLVNLGRMSEEELINLMTAAKFLLRHKQSGKPRKPKAVKIDEKTA